MRQNVCSVVVVPDLECVCGSLKAHTVFDEKVVAHESGFTHTQIASFPLLTLRYPAALDCWLARFEEEECIKSYPIVENGISISLSGSHKLED